MSKFYVNNYRGFKNTVFESKTVNFFIGENSSGKTSMMDAINLMSDLRYWWSFDINSVDIELGNFDDILSKASKEKEFSLGFISSTKTGSETFIVNSYIEKDGLSEICQTVFSSPSGIAQFYYENDHCKYKYRLNEKESKSVVDQYHSSQKDISFKSMNYKTIKIDNTPFILSTLFSIEEKDKDIAKIIEIGNFLGSARATPARIAPIRAKPKPIYTLGKIGNSNEGDNVPFILRSMLNDAAENDSNRKLIDAINSFGKNSGMFDSLKAIQFGKKKTAPFELDIIRNDYDFKISTVGYGVSQILPVIVELLINKNAKVFTIQQPEVHLHPRAQAAFGDFLFDISQESEAIFIIETHSDYIIDRFRFRQKISNSISNSQVIYFNNENCENKINYIGILDNGKYQEDAPIAFREFFLNESIKYLEL